MEGTEDGLNSYAAREIVETLGAMSGGRVLDVATGDGDFINLLMDTLDDFGSFIGVDIDSEELETGKDQFDGKPVELMEMNAEALEFEDASFDTVSISHSLHHIERIDVVLDEMKRVLKSEGRFIVQEMFCDGEQTEAQRTDIQKHHWEARIDVLFGTFHHETLKRREIKDAVSSLDLRDVLTFESAHPVNCLFCERRTICLDPMEESVISQTLEELEKALGRLEELQDLEARSRLEEEGESLKLRVRQHGIFPASHLFSIGWKR